MRKKKLISGFIGIIVGFIVFTLMVNAMGKPSNIPISFDPIDSAQTYLFSFGYSMGIWGWILGGLLFIGVLAIFFFLGIGVYKVIFKREEP